MLENESTDLTKGIKERFLKIEYLNVLRLIEIFRQYYGPNKLS